MRLSSPLLTLVRSPALRPRRKWTEHPFDVLAFGTVFVSSFGNGGLCAEAAAHAASASGASASGASASGASASASAGFVIPDFEQ